MLTEFASAKLNLTLAITGRRADGYHLLGSLVVFVDVGDVLCCQAADELSLEVEGPFSGAMPGMADNLVMQAAQALRDHCKIEKGAALTLTKNLPSGAGLGGGSADAAAVLRLLRRLWQLEVSDSVLQEIALTLGADVPVCLQAWPQHMQGIGEQLASVQLAEGVPRHVVLGWPGVGLSTPKVFRRYAENREAQGKGYDASLSVIEEPVSMAMITDGCNALEDAAMALCAPLAQMHAAMRDQDEGRLTRMSGSGSACFTLFEDKARADAACAALQVASPGCWFAAGQICV